MEGRLLADTIEVMMFKLEREMIPVLRRDLSKFFGDVHLSEEFVSGIGRPDIVLGRIVKDINRSKALPNYQVIELLIKYFNQKNRVVHIDRILGLAISPKKKMLTILDSLVDLGFIERRGEKSFIIKNKYAPLVDNFVSIEAKLSDWKGGLYQALRYKTFSDSAYLAISEDYLAKVDQDLLKQYGVGLISVSPSNARLILKAKKDRPKNTISHHYLTEEFCLSKGYGSILHC